MYEYQLVTNGMEHGRDGETGENAKINGWREKLRTYAYVIKNCTRTGYRYLVLRRPS